MHRIALLAFAMSFALMAGAEELPTFQITMNDGHFRPERVEVPAGKRVKLVLKNEGRTPAEFENLGMRVEKVLAPGVTSFVVLYNLRPGEYRFVDEFHPQGGSVTLIAK